MGHYNSFLVKIWTEDGENLTRGYIQHVGTQEAIYFADWEKMASFMRDHLCWHINGEIRVEAKPPVANPRGDESSPWEQS
jgi:hypothetical protein